MKIILFLHIYQPPTQSSEVTRSITEASYSKIIGLLQKYPRAKIVLNINGSLTEQLFSLGYHHLIDDLGTLAVEGQVELVGSAAYHPLLPKLPDYESHRQIELNDLINRRYFGSAWQPRGFFPPEMFWSPRLATVLEEQGFEWVILDEGACGDHPHSDEPSPVPLFGLCGSELKVLFRNNSLSLGVAFGEICSRGDFLAAATLSRREDSVYVVAVDGETFGHHHPEQLILLEEIFAAADSDEGLELVTVADLLAAAPPTLAVDTKDSAWGPIERWDDPDNRVHRLQWKLTQLAIRSVEDSEDTCRSGSGSDGEVVKARFLLDRALHSDQYWWASRKPYWNPMMVERGAKMLSLVVATVPGVDPSRRKMAEQLYGQITEFLL